MTVERAPAESPTPEFLADFGARWADGWNSHDPERLIAMIGHDFAADCSAWPSPMRSRDDLRAFLRFVWRAMPDLQFELPHGICGSSEGPWASALWLGRGTMTGPLDPPGFAPTNGSVSFKGFDSYGFRDGMLARLVTVFDMMDIGRQVGAVPPSGGAGERAVVWMQHMAAGRMRAKRR